MKQPGRKAADPKKKKPKVKDRSLRRLNVKRGMLDFFCLVALALFAYAGWFLSLGERDNAAACLMVGGLAILLTVLPARQIYREQWYLDKAKVSIGEYAEDIGLERRVSMDPDYFRMLCLFPTGSDDRAFRFSNRITARCRGRRLTLTDAVVPLKGGDLLNGCLIQLEMPRAPLSRFRMVGQTVADEEELTPFFRRQHKLLKAQAQWIPDMAVYADQPLSAQEQDRLNAILMEKGEDLAVAIEGRTFYCFAAGKSCLSAPRKLPGLIRREMLLPLTIPQLPRILDYAFDTVDLHSGQPSAAFDERADRRMAGVQGEIVREKPAPQVRQDKPAPPPEPTLPDRALETDRLILRPFRFEDAQAVFTCWAGDPEAYRYLPWTALPDPEAARRMMDQWLREDQEAPVPRYALELKENGSLAGFIGPEGWQDAAPVLTGALGRSFRGRGYMAEACLALTRELFGRGCPYVLIWAQEDNMPACVTAEKCGYAWIGTQQRQCSPVKPWPVSVRWYRADAATWAPPVPAPKAQPVPAGGTSLYAASAPLFPPAPAQGAPSAGADADPSVAQPAGPAAAGYETPGNPDPLA